MRVVLALLALVALSHAAPIERFSYDQLQDHIGDNSNSYSPFGYQPNSADSVVKLPTLPAELQEAERPPVRFPFQMPGAYQQQAQMPQFVETAARTRNVVPVPHSERYDEQHAGDNQEEMDTPPARAPPVPAASENRFKEKLTPPPMAEAEDSTMQGAAPKAPDADALADGPGSAKTIPLDEAPAPLRPLNEKPRFQQVEPKAEQLKPIPAGMEPTKDNPKPTPVAPVAPAPAPKPGVPTIGGAPAPLDFSSGPSNNGIIPTPEGLPHIPPAPETPVHIIGQMNVDPLYESGPTLHKCVSAGDTGDCRVSFAPSDIHWSVKTVAPGSLAIEEKAKPTEGSHPPGTPKVIISNNPEVAKEQKRLIDLTDSMEKDSEWIKKVKAIITHYKQEIKKVEGVVHNKKFAILGAKKNIQTLVHQEKSRQLNQQLQVALKALNGLNGHQNQLSGKIEQLTRSKDSLLSMISKIKAALHNSGPVVIEGAPKVGDQMRFREKQDLHKNVRGMMTNLLSFLEEKAKAFQPVHTVEVKPGAPVATRAETVIMAEDKSLDEAKEHRNLIAQSHKAPSMDSQLKAIMSKYK